MVSNLLIAAGLQEGGIMVTNNKSFSARIDPRYYTAISDEAARRGISMTDLFEEIVGGFFGKSLPGICKSCGKWNEIESNFCSECGKQMVK